MWQTSRQVRSLHKPSFPDFLLRIPLIICPPCTVPGPSRPEFFSLSWKTFSWHSQQPLNWLMNKLIQFSIVLSDLAAKHFFPFLCWLMITSVFRSFFQVLLAPFLHPLCSFFAASCVCMRPSRLKLLLGSFSSGVVWYRSQLILRVAESWLPPSCTGSPLGSHWAVEAPAQTDSTSGKRSLQSNQTTHYCLLLHCLPASFLHSSTLKIGTTML